MHILNDSYIVLIQKKIEVKNFKSSRLINSMEKFFSKLLTNKLQLKIQQMISIAKTRFMQERHINEWFLYSQELVTLSTRQKIQVGFSRPLMQYHRIFYWTCLESKGFSQNWIRLIRQSILQGTS
jgi:hypothetical protein